MDSALKQRLLGAAVLIALAIIFVPMFFSSSPPKQDSTTLSLSIPPAPERNFETRNLSVDATPKGSAAPKPAKPVPPDPNKVATVNTDAPSTFEAPDHAPPAATKPAPAPAPAAPPAPSASKPGATPVLPPAPATDNEGRFVVSLGIYADAGGAAALVAKVKKLGYPAFAEATEYQGKAAQRVRVGPYADRAAAEGVRLKIKQAEDKVPSSVVDLGDRTKETAKADAGKTDPGKGDAGKGDAGKGDSGKGESGKAEANKSDSTKSDSKAEPAKSGDTPVPTVPADRAGGYAVQVGAFKAEDEANKLRDRLRNGGVAAFIEKAGSGEQTMWKVRAGPYVDRVGADTALANIKQKFQITGMITTQP